MAALEFVYPTDAALEAIDPLEQNSLIESDPIFGYFPPERSDSAELQWDQRDSFTGLMQFRGYNSEPMIVPRNGGTTFRADAGVYGEFSRVDELEMTKRAAYGMARNGPIDITSLVVTERDRLLHRQINRISWILWKLCTEGMYVVPNRVGAVAEYGGFSIQYYDAPVPWTNFADADPTFDFRANTTAGRGYGTTFNSQANAYMNQTTMNWLLSNANEVSLRGRRVKSGNTVNGEGDVAEIFAADGLPKLNVHEGGWLSDGVRTWNTHVPDGVVTVFGHRPTNQRIGEFTYTVNMVNPGRSDPYYRVVNRGMAEGQAPPPSIEVHRGFNGGPKVFYPSSILVMRVGPA